MKRLVSSLAGIVCAAAAFGCQKKEAPPQQAIHAFEKKSLPGPAPSPPPPATAAPPEEAEEKKAVASGGLLKILGSTAGEGLASRGAGPGGGGVGDTIGIGGITTKGRGGGKVGYAEGAALGNAFGSIGDLGGQGGPAADPTTTETYTDHGVNDFVDTVKDHLSTFAVDVDTGSYTLARRKILDGSLPPPAAVRVEEFVNYFRYDYPQPRRGALAVHMDAAPSPFTKGRTLLRVGVQGRTLSISERRPAHLTFLVDVSGSMQSADRLPLAQRALRMLVDNLRDGDSVALVTYAGSTRVVLPPTGMEKKAQIHAAIAELSAGGSTAMGSGIQLAYQQAMRTAGPDSNSRVIILSDGDANVGPSSPQEILALISGYVKEGITVSTVGFGMGNYRDDLMEQFANKGNGNYFYVDSLLQARRVFQEQLGGTLEVIAKDVKLQVDFDPAQVKRYRLIGYENRDIADRDFRNDQVDAGEIGSGHTVTALYELELKDGAGDGLCTVHVRAKRPKGQKAEEAVFPFEGAKLFASFEGAPRDLRFAAAVMGAADVLRRSPHAREWRLEQIQQIARAATPDGNAEREEFVHLLGRSIDVVGRVAAR